MDSTTLTLVGSAGTALATAIAALWRQQLVSQREVKTKLEQCEKKHEECHDRELENARQTAELQIKMVAIEAKTNGYLEAKDDLRQLSERVIKIIDNEDM